MGVYCSKINCMNLYDDFKMQLKGRSDTLSQINWWLVRVTLVITFGFLPQNFGRWWGPMNGIL